MIRLAHRGNHTSARENSYRAVMEALQGPADGVEVDLHLLKDGTVVLHHDPFLDGRRPIPLLTLGFEQFKAQLPFQPMTLETLLSLRPSDKRLVLECKPHPNRQAFCRVISRQLTGSDINNIVLSSENWGILRQLRRLTNLPLAPVLRKLDGLNRARLMAGNYEEWHIRLTLTDSEPFKALKEQLKPTVIAWTVNTREEVGKLEELGIQGIMTDNPALYSATK